MTKKVVAAGATGLVGNAALRHFGNAGGAEVIALSRRKPRELYCARFVPIDLTDAAQCAAAASETKGTTHLIYAALYEEPAARWIWSRRSASMPRCCASGAARWIFPAARRALPRRSTSISSRHRLVGPG